MVAEPIKIINPSGAQLHPVYALFENRQSAEALLERLSVLSISPNAVTILQIVLNEPRGRFKVNQRDLRQSPKFASSSIIGATLGCGLAILIGVLLNRSNFLSLSFIETIFIYFVALSVLGALLGGAVGAVLASYQIPNLEEEILGQESDGFLVIVKAPSHLTTECLNLAHSLGAKKSAIK